MFKSNTFVIKTLGEVSVKFRHISHPEPWQMGHSGNKLSDLFLGKTEFSPYPGKNSLASNRRQRHIYSMKSHPVQFSFPFFPSPVRSRVAESTYIKILTVLKRCGDNFESLIRKMFRKTDIIHRPCEHSIIILGNIVIESTADSCSGTTFNYKFPFYDFRGKVLSALNRPRDFQRQFFRKITQRTGYDSFSSLDCFSVYIAGCIEAYDRSHKQYGNDARQSKMVVFHFDLE